MKYHPTKPDGMKYHPTNSPVPWASISAGTGKGKLVPDNRHRKNPSMRETSNTEGYLRGKVRGNLRGRSTHAVQSITDILLAVYTSIRAREIPGHGTARTAHTGTGTHSEPREGVIIY